MRMRCRVISGMLALMLALSAVAAGAEYTVNRNAPVSATNRHSLEDLRAVIQPGDTIILHHDDNSLVTPLDWTNYTIRSVGSNRFTISALPSAPNPIWAAGASPSIAIDNLRLASGTSGSLVYVNNTGAGFSGEMEITGSILESTGGTGVSMRNMASGTFTNTQILGTMNSVLFENDTPGTIDIVFDNRADMYNRWDGTFTARTSNPNVILSGHNINIGVAEGKYFTIDTVNATGRSTITKTGGGTLKIGSGLNYAHTLAIQQGTVQFKPGAIWSSPPNPDPDAPPATITNSITIASGAVFKPSLSITNWGEYIADPTAEFTGNSNRFALLPDHLFINPFGLFLADPGARLEIGNISTFHAFDDVVRSNGYVLTDIYYLQMITADIAASNAETLSISNKLMSARFVEINDDNREDLKEQFDLDYDLLDGYYLHISDVNNLSSLEGIGDYADAYRLNPNLSELERDMLDTIYARGGVGEYRGYLQTLGGAIIQNSLLAVRHQHNNINGQINRRLTAYQTEELANIPSYLDDEAPAYAEEDPETSYSETWAFLDHGWALQEDVGNEAAYSMGLTTLGIGHDWHADQWIYGGMLAYSTGSMKLENQGATRNDMDFLTAAAYVSWAEDGWYLSGTGTLTYGWNSAHSAYTLPGVTLASDSDFSTTGLGFNLEAGHMLETEVYGFPLRVTPYGSLTYTRAHRESVDDTGARNAALGIDLRKHFGAVDWNVWDASLGFRVAVPMEIEGMTVVPSVDVSYTHTAGKESSDGVVHMYSHPSAGWNPGLMESSRSAIRVAAGVEARIRENVSLGAGCEFEWRKLYWNNRLNVNVSIDF